MQKVQKITRGWPPKRRKEYAARIRRTKIWLHSTGPRTVKGKETSARNAVQHGAYGADWKALRAAFRAHREFLKEVRFRLNKRTYLRSASLSIKRHDKKVDFSWQYM